MKKTIFLLSVILLAVNCQKKNKNFDLKTSSDSENSVNQILKDIEVKTIAYMQTIDKKNMSKPPKWVGVVLADLAGAYMGATMGGSLGGEIGAVSGGIGVGSLASIVVGNQEGLPPNGGGTTLTANSANPYDYTGLIHYDIINCVIANPLLIYSNNQINYDAYRNLAFDRMRANGFNADRYVTLLSLSFYNDNIDPLANKSIVDLINESTIANSVEKNILCSYSTALMNTPESSKFASYSIQVENSITNSSLPPESKTLLLTYMSTARHGVAYWG